MMTSMFSHYHVSSITTKEINPIVEGLYQTLVVCSDSLSPLIPTPSIINLAHKERLHCQRH